MKPACRTALGTTILAAALLAPGCWSHSPDERRVRSPVGASPATSLVWAARIEKPGLPNLHRVSADLYRGAQPTAEGFSQLKEMGVKTVIDLRSFHNDRRKVAGKDLAYEEIPMNAWRARDEDDVRFLQIVSDRSRAPFFVHCQSGADRTGLMCAVYRIAVEGWTKDEALDEMTHGGFGFHAIWSGLPDHIRNMDVEGLKRRARSTQGCVTFSPAPARARVRW